MSKEMRSQLLYRLLITKSRAEIVFLTQQLYRISKEKAEIMADRILTA